MVYPTLSSYKENYKANLTAFLNQYEDNTEIFFLQTEKKKYQDYQNALTKIANKLNSSTTDESNSILLQRNSASDLKNIDFNIYNTIITELNPVLYKTVLSLSAAKNDKIQIDKIALDNHIKSSIVIVNFISDKTFYSNLDFNKIKNLQSQGKPTVIDKSKINAMDLNLENMFKLGLTPEILKTNFEQWVLESKDFSIDFENDLIYTGIEKVRKNLETVKSFINKDLANEGMTEDEIVNYFQGLTSELKKDLDKSLLRVHEDQKLEFILKSLKNMSGSLSDMKNELIEEEINELQKFSGILSEFNFENENITSFDSIELTKEDTTITQPNIPKSKKIGDKWHALLYLIEIEVYKKQIPTNVDGAFIKSEIEQIGKHRCKNSGQGFYRQVRDLKGNIKDNISVKRLFNEGWKTVIIEMSNNDENIIKYLDTF